MTYLDKLKKIDSHRAENKYAERICAELTYLDGVSSLHGGKYDAKLERAADVLLERIEADGTITRGTVIAIEEMLSELAPVAKSLKELFVAHAHIDMNWQWGYNETAVITVDTFRTMLELMREYPEFTFSQSQASTYEIVEKYRPDMLDEIKQRVHEGRWEVTAAEWVEPDKNMPSGESMTRQILEAKKYLTKLLDIPSDMIGVDFVPDTFGHAITVPEILADAGIKYMYHCRGSEGPCFYRYTAPSGKSVLAYKDYSWYNIEISTNAFEIVPRFCAEEKLDTYMCVYGVGDHGGGPTRRDIERILEYRSWPLTPDIKFGTYREFFESAERSGVDFPIIDTERNFLFSGCYTTQSRIKMANRVAEARIFEAEALSATASVMAGSSNDASRFETPWRNILFGHFHDILPGSGVIETREYALGKFQETLATLQTSASMYMNAIADNIDTSGIDFDDATESRSVGAGVGYGAREDKGFKLPSAERGRGTVRVLHVFNPTEHDRDEVTEITVWDHNVDDSQVIITDKDGHELEFVLAEDVKKSVYWGHTFKKYMVRVCVPAFGYSTLIVRQKQCEGHLHPFVRTHEHTDHGFVNDEPIIMENSMLRAVFDKTTAQLISLYDKQTGESLIDKPSCFLRFIEENPIYGFMSWRVGPYMKIVNLNEECAVRMTKLTHTSMFSVFSYTVEYMRSQIDVSIMLRANSSMLEFDVTADWKEDSVRGKMIPQLSFAVPVSYKTIGKSICKIPYGTLVRDEAAFDVPSHGSLGICGESKHIVTLLADTKYGFRYNDGIGQITLIRNAYNPDPYSDRGIHRIRLGVAACAPDGIGEYSDRLCHPMPYVSGRCHKGKLALSGTLLDIDGDIKVSAIKCAEDGDGIVVRMYEEKGKDASVMLKLCRPAERAYITDTNESVICELNVTNGAISFDIPAYSLATVKIIF